eukprot:CAMPEP_0202819566 /NCGR_PEP_ID=MMETSP1389-20130828/9133_1 /ASSEMBLY_ACC=CAM_ASM_000865 /TAXON_ID=302021 /ORGANISM="Rhodomonas sp., Strain CCMP768" /LENGTH=248 /DNA_ID=CAMNT_0049492109 /DNA_START=267 /DNA_END=1013 /DNA_ORIENTATION=+
MISNDQCLSDVGKRVCKESCEEFVNDEADFRRCIVDCQTSRIDEFSFSMAECEMELKNQSGCTCQEVSVGAWTCDCEGQLLGVVQDEWGRACYLVGAIGFAGAFLLTGLPAINVALRGSKGFCRVTCYSVFSGVLFLPFLAVGGAFLVVGFLFHYPGPVKDYLDNCEAELEKTAFGEGAARVSADCGLSAFCDAVKALAGEVTGPAVGAGIPFAVAGLFMFSGLYACCCCSKSLPNSDRIVDKYSIED